MIDKRFPLIEISGDARSRGLQHGHLLKDRIHQSLKFYRRVFGQTEPEIFRQASHFKEVIRDFSEEYAREIEAIAEAAEIDPLWIYALNARSEILTMFVSECTAMYSTDYKILAQTWDWAEELEKLAVVMRINSEDNEILMMTEPGIIGKIGMNRHGIGVTLNFLHRDGQLPGLPIHIILRAVLDQTSIEDAFTLVKQVQGGQAGNIIIADKTGRYTDFELAGDRYFEINDLRNMFHTNHYLADPTLNTRDEEKLASSRSRYLRASELIDNVELSEEQIYSIITDQTYELPICRPYREDPDLGNTGTICGIVMMLEQGEFRITPGNPKDHSFLSYTFTT
jgi:isopenicillin-N N-acyltransferase-like protein